MKWVNGLLCNADTNIISITESNQVVRTVKKVSVIVPAYNVEKYIHRAIESVMQQTYENVELVIVDDGSSDATWDIIQQYAGRDDRIFPYHQNNAGVSAARNKALEMISGEYVLFLDSDDWLEKHTVEYLMDLADKNPGMLVSASWYHTWLSDDGTTKSMRQREPADLAAVGIEEALCSIGTSKYSLQSACYKLYDASVIQKNHISFACDISHGEDGLFVFHYLIHTEGLVYSTEPLWYILEREGSATRSPYNRGRLTAITAVERMIDFKFPSVKVQQILYAYLFARVEGVMRVALKTEREDAKQDLITLREYLREHKAYLKNEAMRNKERLRYFIYAYIPFAIIKRWRKLKDK